MGNRPEPFVIPAGLTLDQAADGLSIDHEGDIILYGTLGQPLKRVRSSGGNVVLHAEATSKSASIAEISAAGRVEIHGNATAEQISGAGIEIHGDAAVSRIHAGEQGVLIRGGAKVHEIRSAGEVVIHGPTDADSLSAESGDVVLHGTARADFISADKGSVYLHGPATAHAVAVRGGDLVARGDLTVEEATAVDGELAVESAVTARLLKAGRIALRGETNTVGVVQGLHRISIGRGQIRSDILIAPRIELDPETSGKITVIECRNEPGPNSIKGGLSLADLAEFGVDAQKYLRDRGLAPLGEAGPEPTPVARTRSFESRSAPAPIPDAAPLAAEPASVLAPEPTPEPDPEPAIAAHEDTSGDAPVEALAADSLGEDEDLVEERSFSRDSASAAAVVDLFGDDEGEERYGDNGVEQSGSFAAVSVSSLEADFDGTEALLQDAFDDEEATSARDAAAEDSEVIEMTVAASPPQEEYSAAALEEEPGPASVSVNDHAPSLDAAEDLLGLEDDLTAAQDDLSLTAGISDSILPHADIDLGDLGSDSLFSEDLTPAPGHDAPFQAHAGETSGSNGAENHSIEQIFDLTLEEDEDSVAEEEDPIYAQMVDTVQRIEACYEGSELPPAVTQLNELIEARDYEAIRDDITNIWNRLLKFHQKRGLRIQPQVTTTFNTINTIVRKL